MSAADQILKSLAKAGGDLVDPPVLLEASVPLELSGEAVRSRICTFVDQTGKEWALRPDLTLVVAQDEIKCRQSGQTGDRVRRYRGPVYRLPANAMDPLEYDQVGLERFGGRRSGEADVWLVETLTQAVRACGVETGHASFGDLSVFPRFLDAMGLAPDIAAGLKRAFRQEGGVRAFLNGQARDQRGFSSRLDGMPRDDIAAFVDEIFSMTGVRPVGQRSADEIVERLFERSRVTAGGGVSPAHADLIDRLLKMDVPLKDAPESLGAIASDLGSEDLTSFVDEFRDKVEKLVAGSAVSFVGSARFSAQFGRRFTYYDGMVFEIARDESEEARRRPFVAGGRYDSLLTLLSSGVVDTTALGGVVIPHRLASEPGAPT